jgi:hypothetical protein
MVLSLSRATFLICFDTSGSKNPVIGFFPALDGATVCKSLSPWLPCSLGASVADVSNTRGLEKACPAAWLKACAIELRFTNVLLLVDMSTCRFFYKTTGILVVDNLLLVLQVALETCLHAYLFTNPLVQLEGLFACLASRLVLLGYLAVHETVVIRGSHRQVDWRNGSVIGAYCRICF